MPTPRRLLLLCGGCVVLGIGVALLLTADLGSDGYSTLVNGISLGFGIPFGAANAPVGLTFVVLAAAARGATRSRHDRAAASSSGRSSR